MSASTIPVRLTRKQIKYLEFLSGKVRPDRFDNVTEHMLKPLLSHGLIECDEKSKDKPMVCRWWKLTERGICFREIITRDKEDINDSRAAMDSYGCSLHARNGKSRN